MKPLKPTYAGKKKFIGIGAGVMDDKSGVTPNEGTPMGTFYGTGVKNPQGRMRDASVGYRPVSKTQLGTPPKNLA